MTLPAVLQTVQELASDGSDWRVREALEEERLELVSDQFSYMLIDNGSGRVFFECTHEGRVTETSWPKRLPIDKEAHKWLRSEERKWSCREEAKEWPSEELERWLARYQGGEFAESKPELAQAASEQAEIFIVELARRKVSSRGL